MAKWVTMCSIGLHDNCEDPYRGNSLQTSLWKWSNHTCGNAYANHMVMRYQDKENKEQLRLNLDLIDEVRMNAEHRTTRYKNLMARQYDAMVKPRRFNIRDFILKRVSLATRYPTHGKLGLNWEGPYRVINCKRQGSYYLEVLDGRRLEHPWSVEHQRKYYQ